MNSLRGTYLSDPPTLRNKCFLNPAHHIAFILNRMGGKQIAFHRFHAQTCNVSHLHQLFIFVYTIKLDAARSLEAKVFKMYLSENLPTTRLDIGYIVNTIAHICLHASSADLKVVGD